MVDVWRRGRWRSVAAAACIFGATALLGASSAAGIAPRRPFRVLQMNLCDSGIAECYTGRSVTEAASIVRADTPDLVTLNEVCRADVSTLDIAFAATWPGATIVSVFKAAPDRRTGEATRCRDGDEYGIGLLLHISAGVAHLTYTGIYPTQDPGDPEERAWICVDAIDGFYACTTHLANANPTVALAQCTYLLTRAIPAVRGRDGYQPTVLGGDLNLRSGGRPDVRSCVPAGYLRSDDGGVQQIVATTDFMMSSAHAIGMDHTTDHPGLLVAYTLGLA